MGIVYLEYRADTEPLAIVKRPNGKKPITSTQISRTRPEVRRRTLDAKYEREYQ